MVKLLWVVVALPGALLVGILLVESLLRLRTPRSDSNPFKGWPWHVRDALMGWRNCPGYNKDGIEVDKRGFRYIPPPPQPPVHRIVTIGDSGTFGIWQAQPGIGLRFDNYPEELAKKIRASGRTDVEVINVGTLGYHFSHGLRLLMTRVKALRPTVVTVRLGFNDHSLAWNPAFRAIEPRSAVRRFLLYRFWRWRLFERVLRAAQRFCLGPDEMSVRWVSREELLYNLQRMVEESRRQRFALAFVDYPLRPKERGESLTVPTPYGLLGVESLEELHTLHDEYMRVVRSVAEEEGIPWVRTEDALLSDPDMFSIFDMVHPTAKGAKLIAARLFEVLERRGLLGPQPDNFREPLPVVDALTLAQACGETDLPVDLEGPSRDIANHLSELRLRALWLSDQAKLKVWLGAHLLNEKLAKEEFDKDVNRVATILSLAEEKRQAISTQAWAIRRKLLVQAARLLSDTEDHASLLGVLHTLYEEEDRVIEQVCGKAAADWVRVERRIERARALALICALGNLPFDEAFSAPAVRLDSLLCPQKPSV